MSKLNFNERQKVERERRQREIVAQLYALLEDATTYGVLDELQNYCFNPNTINDFCHAVTESNKNLNPQDTTEPCESPTDN